MQAQSRGELEDAAHGLASAYAAAPAPCSSASLALLFEAVDAQLAAARRLDGPSLCRVEAFIKAAGANAACADHRADLNAATRELERARRRSGSECATAEPVLRAPDGGVPLNVETPAPAPRQPALAPSRPAAPVEGADHPDRRRRRLQAAGASLLGIGVGASAAALAGMIRGVGLERQAEAHIAVNPAGCDRTVGLTGECANLARDGKRMNQLAIGAGIAAAALVITGAVLLITGARARRAVRRAGVAMRGATLTVRF